MSAPQALGAPLRTCRPARRQSGPVRRSAVAVAAPERPTQSTWSPDSWRSKKALQMPEYSNPAALQAAVAELRRCPPLIFAGEVRQHMGSMHAQRTLGVGPRCSAAFRGQTISPLPTRIGATALDP